MKKERMKKEKKTATHDADVIDDDASLLIVNNGDQPHVFLSYSTSSAPARNS